jgi:hypothetical protein
LVAAIPERKSRYETDIKGIAQVPIGKTGWFGVDDEDRSPRPKRSDKKSTPRLWCFDFNERVPPFALLPAL